jgi:phosphopantetheinyl transferase (holo-ACP synthase)
MKHLQTEHQRCHDQRHEDQRLHAGRYGIKECLKMAFIKFPGENGRNDPQTEHNIKERFIFNAQFKSAALKIINQEEGKY